MGGPSIVVADCSKLKTKCWGGFFLQYVIYTKVMLLSHLTCMHSDDLGILLSGLGWGASQVRSRDFL